MNRLPARHRPLLRTSRPRRHHRPGTSLEGEVPLGILVEVLIANRLLRPKALFRVGEWARTAEVTDYYDLTVEQLNDDRLGLASQCLAVHAPFIEAALVLKAIEHFRLDVHQIHYDLSTAELYGAYEIKTTEGQPPPSPMPAYGRTKSGRKHIKQVQFGLDVTGDGGVPVGHLGLDGNAGEVNSHLENLKLLGHTLPKGKLLYIADTKLDAPDNLLAIAARKGQFLCGGALSPNSRNVTPTRRDRLHKVNYFPESQAKLPPEKRDKYQAVEVSEHIEGTVDGQLVWSHYRLIFVWSESQGAAGGQDARAARGQDPGGIRGGAAEPGPVQPEDDRGDPPPPGGGEGEVWRGGAVRLSSQSGRGRSLPARLGTGRRSALALVAAGGRVCAEDQLAAQTTG